MKQKEKKNLSFLLILIFCFLTRFLYHFYNTEYQLYSDSYQYIDRAIEILQGRPVINPIRYPIYPLILSFFAEPSTGSIYPSDIHIDYPSVILFQELLGLVTAVVILSCVYMLLSNTAGFIIFGILFSLFINFFGFEKNILTENIAVFLLSALSLLCILYIKHKQFILSIGIFIFFSLLFLLHPLFTFLPFFISPMLLFHLVYYRQYRQAFIILGMTVLFALLPLTYQYYNRKIYSFSGLSTVSLHNLYAKTIQYKLDPGKASTHSTYEPLLRECSWKYMNGIPFDFANGITFHTTPGTPFDITPCVSLLAIDDDAYATSSAPIIGSFAQAVIRSQMLAYIAQSVQLFPMILLATETEDHWILTNSSVQFLQVLWSRLQDINFYLQRCFIIFFIFYPIHVFRFLKKPTRENTLLAIIGSFTVYTLIFVAFFSYANFFRYIVPVIPFLFLFCLYYGLMLFQKFIHKLSKI